MRFTQKSMQDLFHHGYQGPVFLVAELSANHNGSLRRAKNTIKAAADAGADAIKLQTYTPESITIDCDRPPFFLKQGTPWDGVTLYSLYQTAFTPWEWHEELFDTAAKCGLLCFSTPFDNAAVDFLEQFDPPATKIASFEANDIALLKYAASKGRPMIISTGLSDTAEIAEAGAACRAAGNRRIAFLKCVSSYPASPEDMNLLTIHDMAVRFRSTVGLSDHSLGIEAACAATALGAKIIEKHFTLSRKDRGPDSAFSMEPAEFRRMAESVRIIEKTLGRISYRPDEKSAKNLVFKRSLFAVEDIPKNGRFTECNVRSIRPGYGLAPKHLPEVLKKRAASKIMRGTPLSWRLVKP